MKIPSLAAIAAFGFLSAATAAIPTSTPTPTPLQECAASSVPMGCLDAKLKAANQQLNTTLKAAQERLEQLQAHGRRPLLGAFIDSQRKFNAYREAQCNWQGIRAAPGANGADYVKDCQIRVTLGREQELAEFVAGDERPAAAAIAPTVAEVESRSPGNAEPLAADQAAAVDQPEKPAVASDSSAMGSRGSEWRLVHWVANGAEKPIIADSAVTIAIDPSGKIAGNASVNRFSGACRFDADGRLEWPRTGFTLTRMAGPQPLMAQERAFLESLRRTTLYRVDGQELVLRSRSGATVLTFIR